MVLGTDYLNIPVPEFISREKNLGNFDIMEKMVNDNENNYDEDTMKRLNYELFRTKILKLNYGLSRKKLLAEMEKYVKDFSSMDVENYIKNGTLDRIYLEGEERFFNRSIENLHYLNNNIREKSAFNISPNKAFLEYVSRKISMGNIGKYRIKYEISIKFERSGTYKVWLPVPLENDYQKNVKIIETYPKNYRILEGEQRSLYMYDTSEVFKAVFSLETQDVTIRDGDVNSRKDIYLEEKFPHVSITPYIEKMAEKITSEETVNLKKLLKLYKFITEKIRFVYAKSYLLYDNISEYTLSNMVGDSCMQSILLIAMARSLNIPARWRGGYVISENSIIPHHWAEVYTEEYGFIPVDPVFGNYSLNHYNLREFYFGNMEGLRIITSGDFNVDFSEPGKFWRLDPVTNDLGEVETDSEKVINHRTEIKLLGIENY
ncbi:MAG: transglutaminase domain-containing protein [Thermoplasmata archaeon]